MKKLKWNPKHLACFRSGYDECRFAILSELRAILTKSADQQALAELISKIEVEQKEDHWKIAQEAQPNLSRAEWESWMEETARQILEARKTNERRLLTALDGTP
jgi:hypothetical protein